MNIRTIGGRDAQTATCRALLIGGVASGQGKTTLTVALARRFSRQGLRVRVFKSGPDFLDPLMLEAGCGHAVENLDLWMVGRERSLALLGAAARQSDLILVEGAMGLYDGTPSPADLAMSLGLPVAAVIDAGGMAQSFGAVALGLRDYRALNFAGVLANNVAGAAHLEMLRGSLPDSIGLLGAMRRVPSALPERHLGLGMPQEIPDLAQRLGAIDEGLAFADASVIGKVNFEPNATAVPQRLLEGKVVAVASDAAFCFIYPSNLATLDALGARIVRFSPLADEAVPADADALWLPGGYPELHAGRLSAARRWRSSVAAFHAQGLPILAECGGMMSIVESLTDAAGCAYPMAGLLSGHVYMTGRVTAIGPMQLSAGHANESLRGHTFHYSRLETSLAPWRVTARPGASHVVEPVYRLGKLTASYFHAYFPSSPVFTAALFGANPAGYIIGGDHPQRAHS